MTRGRVCLPSPDQELRVSLRVHSAALRPHVLLHGAQTTFQSEHLHSSSLSLSQLVSHLQNHLPFGAPSSSRLNPKALWSPFLETVQVSPAA